MGDEPTPVQIDETRKLSTDEEGAATPVGGGEPEAEAEAENQGDGGEEPTPENED